MLVPEVGKEASYLILGFLFLIIFTSFFQFELHRDTLKQHLLFSILFTAVRYIIIPVAIFYLVDGWDRFWAFALAFLFLLPPGVSSPAIVSLLKGNFQLAISILVFGNIIALLTIPLLVPVWMGMSGTISTGRLLFTLIVTIVIPFIIHLPLRKNRRFSSGARQFLPTVTVISLSAITILGIAKNKEHLTGNPSQLIWFLALGIGMYIFIFAMGWLFSPGRIQKDRVSAGIESAMNNIGLGVSLSILYFAPRFTLYYIAVQFSWIIMLIPLKYLVRKYFIPN